jgi:5-methyltetrahydrofolate--homocysteine methyltransferase
MKFWNVTHRPQNLRQRSTILNEVLLPAMKDVGDKFGAGELILPFVLQSAEVMKIAVGLFGKFPGKERGVYQGQAGFSYGVR